MNNLVIKCQQLAKIYRDGELCVKVFDGINVSISESVSMKSSFFASDNIFRIRWSSVLR